MLFKAFSEPMPDKVPAGTKGMICHVGFGGEDPRTGDYYTFLETMAGGFGGRIRSDGPDAVQTNVQNTQNAPVEETELNYPVRILRYGLIPDSEGPGRFRGGLGLVRDYVFPDHEPIFTTLADRAVFPPWGLFGGEEGRPARYLAIAGGEATPISSKGTAPVERGTMIRVETCGGGGYGPAWERDPPSRAEGRVRGEDQRRARPRRLRGGHRRERRVGRHGEHRRAAPGAQGAGGRVMSERFRLGVDIGGTFTDAVLLSESSGATRIAKVPSTPSDPSRGFLNAVDRILADADVAPEAISYLVHGTTVATNSIIEGKTPRTAFITTEGFRDMLEIGRQVRPTLYDVHFEKPRPLVPRNLCFEVSERLDARGGVLQPLDEARVHEIARTLAEQDVVSVAVCLLHGYLNPVHEQRIGELLRSHNRDLVISLSSDVCPEFREYFRASTTIINACVRPVLARYLADIESRLRGHGMTAELLIMQSSGGVLTFETGAEKPAYMVESGPAAGVIVANYIAGELGHANAISFDMGGTTAKVGLILDGQPKVTKEYEVGAQANPGVGQARASGYPIRTPVIDLVEIGAGGGSIAWVDSGGILRVGPRSAGADPGPICYGQGGEEPTITDANLTLGRLDPGYFLGGEMGLSVDAARDGITRRCAEPMRLDPVACANGIVEIANAAMTNALRVMTVQRGIDPRELVMVAFGGAGPLHAGRLCEEMNIGLLIVPPSPGTASALGLLVTDLKHEFSRTRIMEEGEEDLDEINGLFAAMEAEGRAVLQREGLVDERISFVRQVEMRYAGQSHELAVDFPAGESDRRNPCERLRERFHADHDRSYGHGYPDEPTELVNFRLSALGSIRKPRMREVAAHSGPASDARKGMRQVHFDAAGGFVETPVYDRAHLGAGHRFDGPAIVEEMDSTTLVLPGYGVEVDRYGNLLISPAG